MTERNLHIVSFNIPYPPNYGGVIDVFYKIKALARLGIKVHLHCFQYGREEADQLEAICASVHYYQRKKLYQAFYSSVPYIVASRTSGELLSALVEDDYPILFEGLHTCSYLSHPSLRDRLKVVRMHNVEWDYYRSLGKAERNFFRRFYFFQEAKRLKEFEHVLESASMIFAISESDYAQLSESYDGKVHYVPAFHPNEQVRSKPGKGEYILYHGSLNVVENNQAAIYLLRKVYEGLDVHFKIAGKSPLNVLKNMCAKTENVQLIADPSQEVLDNMLRHAHINLLPTFQATGIKLKLLNALFNGRFCVVNNRMVQNTGLEDLCHIENDSKKMHLLIKKLLKEEFDASELERREKVLAKHFSNDVNAEKMINLMWSLDQ